MAAPSVESTGVRTCGNVPRECASAGTGTPNCICRDACRPAVLQCERKTCKWTRRQRQYHSGGSYDTIDLIPEGDSESEVCNTPCALLLAGVVSDIGGSVK